MGDRLLWHPRRRMPGWLAYSLALLTWVAQPAPADLVLEISDVEIAPGEVGELLVTVRSNDGAIDVLGWDTELTVASLGELVAFVRAEQSTAEPDAGHLPGFSATVKQGFLQVHGFAPTRTQATRLTEKDGIVALYRADVFVSPLATPGTELTINFSARNFTNFVDLDIRPIPLTRGAGTLTVAAVPEPAAWQFFVAVFATLRVGRPLSDRDTAGRNPVAKNARQSRR